MSAPLSGSALRRLLLISLSASAVLHAYGIPRMLALWSGDDWTPAQRILGYAGPIVLLAHAPALLALRWLHDEHLPRFAFGILLVFSVVVNFVVYVSGTDTSPHVIYGALLVALATMMVPPRQVHVVAAVFCVQFVVLALLQYGSWLPREDFHLATVDLDSGPRSLISLLMTVVGSVSIIAVCASQVSGALERARGELVRLATSDALTGLPNRRRFEEIFEREIQRARRSLGPVALLMCDADRFKAINDAHGHDVGDEVLRAVAEVLASGVRQGIDVAARVGGEEFAVLLPDTDRAGAERAAERILAEVRALQFETESHGFGVTLSIGLVVASGPSLEAADVYKRADRLLYRAKEAGRDRVVADVLA